MPVNTDKLADALSQFGGQFEPFEDVFTAIYVSDNGDGTHEVDMNTPDGSQGVRRTVRGRVIAWPGVHLRIGVNRQDFGPREYVILGPDETAYGSSPAPSMLEPHGTTHNYRGPDEVNGLHTWQLYPLRTQADSGLTVVTLAGYYEAGGQYRALSSNTTTDLTAYVAALTSGQKQYLTLSIGAAGTITVTEGVKTALPQMEHIAGPPAGERGLAAVLIEYGQTTITNDDVKIDLRHIAGGTEPGGGVVPVWENVITVAKSGGMHTTVQAGINGWAAAYDAVWVMPGDYGETISIAQDGMALKGWIGWRKQGSLGSLVSGSDDILTLAVLNGNCHIQNMSFKRTLSGGAGEFIAVDSAVNRYIRLVDCRIVLDDGATARDLTGIKIDGAATWPSIISRCYIDVNTTGAEQAIELIGTNTVIIEDSFIAGGDIVATAGVTLELRNCYIFGDVTGIAGADLVIYNSTHIRGTVSGWDSVTGPYVQGATHNLIMPVATFSIYDGPLMLLYSDAGISQVAQWDASTGIIQVADVYRFGDPDTYLNLLTDEMRVYCGGILMMTLRETAQDIITINDGGVDVDFVVEALGVADALQVRGSDGQITLGALTAGFVQSDANGVLSSAAIVEADLPEFIIGTTDTDGTPGSLFFAGAAGVIQQDNANLFWDDTNDRLGIGTNVIPHGGIGGAMLAMEGANATLATGPHIQITTDADDYPVFQMLNWGHDNIQIRFDNYWDGAERSSDAGSNFRIVKTSDLLEIDYDSGVAQGNVITWNTAFSIDTTGDIKIPNIRSGATQAGAGAAADELWKTNGHATLPDNVVMIGV